MMDASLSGWVVALVSLLKQTWSLEEFHLSYQHYRAQMDSVIPTFARARNKNPVEQGHSHGLHHPSRRHKSRHSHLRHGKSADRRLSQTSVFGSREIGSLSGGGYSPLLLVRDTRCGCPGIQIQKQIGQVCCQVQCHLGICSGCSDDTVGSV